MKRAIGICLLAAVISAVANAGGEASKRRPVRIDQKAPEFANIDAWINSSPLTLPQLKGKVIVVHFMAFG